MAYSGTTLRLLKKKSLKTRVKGAQKENGNSLKHGAHSDATASMLDGRSVLAKYLQKVEENHVQDLGGFESLSAMERILLKRVINLERRIVLFENQCLEKPESSDLTYLAWVNSQRLLLAQLGLKRRKREVNLSDYLKQKGQAG